MSVRISKVTLGDKRSGKLLSYDVVCDVAPEELRTILPPIMEDIDTQLDGWIKKKPPEPEKANEAWRQDTVTEAQLKKIRAVGSDVTKAGVVKNYLANNNVDKLEGLNKGQGSDLITILKESD